MRRRWREIARDSLTRLHNKLHVTSIQITHENRCEASRRVFGGKVTQREQQHLRAIEWEKKDNEKNVHNCGIILCKPRKSLLSIFFFIKKKRSRQRARVQIRVECREFVVVIAAAVVGCIYHGSRKHMAIGEIQTTDFCRFLRLVRRCLMPAQKGCCSRQHRICGLIWWEISIEWPCCCIIRAGTLCWNWFALRRVGLIVSHDHETWETQRERTRERGKVSRAQNCFSSLWKVFISSPLLLTWASECWLQLFCFSAELEREKKLLLMFSDRTVSPDHSFSQWYNAEWPRASSMWRASEVKVYNFLTCFKYTFRGEWEEILLM